MSKKSILMVILLAVGVPILSQSEEKDLDTTIQTSIPVNPQTLPAEIRYFEIHSGKKLIGACGYSLAPYEGGRWKLDGWTIISASIYDSTILVRMNEKAILDGAMRLSSSKITLSTGQTIEISMADSSNVIIQTTITEAQDTEAENKIEGKGEDKSEDRTAKRSEILSERPQSDQFTEKQDKSGAQLKDSRSPSNRDRKIPKHETQETFEQKPEKKTKVYTKNIQTSSSPYLLADYCFHHWAILVKALKPRFEGIQKFPVLRPTVSEIIDLLAQVRHAEYVKGVVAYKIDFTGENIQSSLWADSTNGSLVQLSIPSQNITITQTPTMPDTSAFMSFILAEKVKPTVSAIKSDKHIEKPLEIKELTVELDIKLEGEFSGERAWQVLKGKFDGGTLRGSISVTTKKYDGKGSAKLGDEIPDAAKKYTQPSEGIPSDNSYILAKANEFSITNFWEIATSVSKWVAGRVRNSPDKDNPLEALLYGRGNALARARLAVAIMRAKGIPSRILGGLCYFAGYWIPHYWVEAWIGNKPGWRPLDPTTGETEQFSAVHITLWEGKGSVGEGTVKVVNAK